MYVCNCANKASNHINSRPTNGRGVRLTPEIRFLKFLVMKYFALPILVCLGALYVV